MLKHHATSENNRPASEQRLLAMLLRELLKAEQFDSLADLTEALKRRCARLRVRYTNDDLNEALRLVGSNTPLLTAGEPRSPVQFVPTGTNCPTELSPAAAANLVGELLARVARERGLR